MTAYRQPYLDSIIFLAHSVFHFVRSHFLRVPRAEDTRIETMFSNMSRRIKWQFFVETQRIKCVVQEEGVGREFETSPRSELARCGKTANLKRKNYKRVSADTMFPNRSIQCRLTLYRILFINY